MVLWDKISQNHQKFCCHHQHDVSMTSSSIFQYSSTSKLELPYLQSDLAEIWHKGQFRTLISNLNQKNQYENDLCKKKTISY